jgi:hypothetical protein
VRREGFCSLSPPRLGRNVILSSFGMLRINSGEESRLCNWLKCEMLRFAQHDILGIARIATQFHLKMIVRGKE